MISFDEFLKQDEADKYNMLQECNAIIKQKENIIKEVRQFIYKCNDGKQGINFSGCSKLLEILDKEGNNNE